VPCTTAWVGWRRPRIGPPFAPDHLVVALRAGEDSGWQERGLLDELQERFLAEAVLFALIASLALPLGGWIGAWRPPPRQVTAALLAFASGALISAVAFELFDDAVEHGGTWQAGAAFLGGATTFIVVDSWLDRRTERRSAAGGSVGFALWAGVTLDGLPENLAMGVGLIESSNPALLVAIFASNFPEAVVGAQKMREAGLGRGPVLAIWSGTAIILALAVIAGHGAFGDLGEAALAWPLGFAAGAVLASLADTLMPEAFEEAKQNPRIAYFTALGFLLSFVIAGA
jgi:ZIP family zinc transporter